MSIQVTQIDSQIADYGAIGRHVQRTFEVSGIRNTAGDAEIYRVTLWGQYNDGSIRHDVSVQRPNGRFAALNPRNHHQRVRSVFAALRDVTDAYIDANEAAIRGEEA